MTIKTYKVCLGRLVAWPTGAPLARSHQLFDADLDHPAYAFLRGQSHKFVVDGAGEGAGGERARVDEAGARYLADRGWDEHEARILAERDAQAEREGREAREAREVGGHGNGARAASPVVASTVAAPLVAASSFSPDVGRVEILARVDAAASPADVDRILAEYGVTRRHLGAWRRAARAAGGSDLAEIVGALTGPAVHLAEGSGA